MFLDQLDDFSREQMEQLELVAMDEDAKRDALAIIKNLEINLKALNFEGEADIVGVKILGAQSELALLSKCFADIGNYNAKVVENIENVEMGNPIEEIPAEIQENFDRCESHVTRIKEETAKNLILEFKSNNEFFVSANSDLYKDTVNQMVEMANLSAMMINQGRYDIDNVGFVIICGGSDSQYGECIETDGISLSFDVQNDQICRCPLPDIDESERRILLGLDLE
jgi:hypothetical protein